jgi:hypothetical protein
MSGVEQQVVNIVKEKGYCDVYGDGILSMWGLIAGYEDGKPVVLGDRWRLDQFCRDTKLLVLARGHELCFSPDPQP